MMTTMMVMLMMMVLCPKTGSLAFTPPRDEMSEVVSHCLPHRQLWVSNLSKVATQWLEEVEIDLNWRPLGYKAQKILLHHHAALMTLLIPIILMIYCKICYTIWQGKRGETLLQICNYHYHRLNSKALLYVLSIKTGEIKGESTSSSTDI